MKTPRQFVASIVVGAMVLAVVFAAQRAYAQQSLMQRFNQLDTDGNGQLTRNELRQSAIFDRLDLNQDNEITEQEAVKANAAGALRGIVDFPEQEAPVPAFDVNDSEPSAIAPSLPVRQGPKRVAPGDHGIGRFLADFAFSDLGGKSHRLSDFSMRRSVVLAMTSTSCPISKKYLPTLAELAREFEARGVQFILVNSQSVDNLDEMHAAQQVLGSNALYVFDKDGSFAKAIGSQTTTDVIVIDAARTVIYHGAIDDQYGFGYSIDAPWSKYLANALNAMLTDQPLSVAATLAPGCALDIDEMPNEVANSTYHQQISRLVQRHCVDCHREDGVGPFRLDTYEDVVAHAPMISQVIEPGVMPPWFAAPAEAGQASPWANDRSLSQREKNELIEWMASDHPAGDPKDSPLAKRYSGEWMIGTPDLIIQLPRPIEIKAQGTMPYQFVTAETTLTEDRWVQGYEIIPTDRSVVHHVIVNVHAKGAGRILDREEGIGGYWAAYVPGNTHQVYPDGFARKLKAGATVSFQIHYTPNGSATQDQLRMGLIFAKEPPKYVIETIPLADRNLQIPPGEANHVEFMSRRVPTDLNVLAYMAHMHVRGKSFKYELTSANGKTETLLDIPRYDFNWQLRYDYAQPRWIPAGSTMKVTAVFDNSDSNPANPDPTKTVGWGPQTFDEMMIGYVEIYRPLDDLGDTADSTTVHSADGRPNGDAAKSRSVIGQIFQQLDRNGNGKVEGDEIPAARQQQIMRLDANNDGAISLDEAERLSRFRSGS